MNYNNMRNSTNDKHNFEKELYGKLYSTRPESKNYDRNPRYENEYDERYYNQPDPSFQPKKKNRMLARGDFSEKHQGTFALTYDNVEEYRSSKKVFQKKYEDPIKPPEFIPPANFKRPGRNPIVHGEVYREPEVRVKPDQISNVFNTTPINSNAERRTY
jgi:hypothetical protein